ncbi:hypothetical protein [Mixta gaviniae]|uniref:Uncharacterized protein n=1 Tax=Mixta gaviniae TaxID=665914 RepID=A0A1X1D8D4_9GAMM|nr:hypothetical protein [Mixta gaviniae]AUX93472.1 hypothetical protein C2E15_10535 [Mixta gaviniae]ORM72914.1 hypothetical protein HA44_20060 [Mixta gaviniae]
MKKRLAILLFMAGCGVAQAASDVSNQAESYIVGLCAMTGEQQASGQTQEQYVQKLKDMAKRGTSPYAMDKPEFNEDEAEKVAAAYMQLPDAVKKKNHQDQDACKKATMAQYQKAE